MDSAMKGCTLCLMYHTHIPVVWVFPQSIHLLNPFPTSTNRNPKEKHSNPGQLCVPPLILELYVSPLYGIVYSLLSSKKLLPFPSPLLKQAPCPAISDPLNPSQLNPLEPYPIMRKKVNISGSKTPVLTPFQIFSLISSSPSPFFASGQIPSLSSHSSSIPTGRAIKAP